MRALRLLSVVAVILLVGCAGETIRRDAYGIVTSPSTLAGCATADVVTTAALVSHGLAHEANPLLAPSVNAHHFMPMALSKLSIVGLVWWLYELVKPNKGMDTGVAVANVATCGVASHNAALFIR